MYPKEVIYLTKVGDLVVSSNLSLNFRDCITLAKDGDVVNVDQNDGWVPPVVTLDEDREVGQSQSQVVEGGILSIVRASHIQ